VLETLLSLTSKQAGGWFKDSLRTLGGLDQLVNTGLSLCWCSLSVCQSIRPPARPPVSAAEPVTLCLFGA